MKYIEMSVDEAIEILQKSKGKRVMVAIRDLEHNDDAMFFPKLKAECEDMIGRAETISSMCDDFVKQLRLYTEKQKDIVNIRNVGYQQIILLKE